MNASLLRKSIAATFAILLMAGPAHATAQSNPAPANSGVNPAATGPVSLKGDVKLEKTVTENGIGRLELLEPTVVVPGDRLRFTTHYRNDGAVPVTNFIVTNPLPSAVVMTDDAAANAEVSVDGGKTWGVLSTLKVADAQSGQRPAAASDVTHVRWTIAQIAPGASGEVEYHAIVR